MNALSAAAAYYLAAGRREEELDEDGRCQDVYVRTPELVLMARRVDSSAPFGRIIDVRCRFEPERCDAWHLHFLAGAAYAASSLLSGCGHTIDVTAERTEICRDGACLVLEPGRLSYSQAQPETEVQPVIQRIRKGK